MNQAGIDLLKRFEGFCPAAYPDPATGGEPYTIGYGFTTGVELGDTITREDAEIRLKFEVAAFESDVSKLVTRTPDPNQLAAMVCLAYNIGLGNFSSSTMLRLHNSGDLYGAANEILLWNRAAGHVMQGLINRREAERSLYLATS